jgi:pSer/pThr/pTyr-binding forkhead associated (FHA) protein
MSTLRLVLVPTSGPPFEVTKDSCLLGRDPSCDLSVTDGSISRRHAKIEKRGDSWVVVDQASANGTFLDSQKITGEAPLRAGQELRLGAVAFRVEITGTSSVDDPGATVLQPVGVPLPPPPKPAPPAPATPPPAPPKATAPPPPPPPPPPPAPPKAAAPPPRPPAPAKPAAPPPPRPAGGAVPTRPDQAAPSSRPAPKGEKKGKGPVFWIGTGCCGCLTLALLLGALIFGGIYFATKGPVEAIDKQLTEIKSGQIDAAYARLSQSYQAVVSRSDFERMIAAHATLRDNASSSFMSRSVKNNTAHLAGTLTSTANDKESVTYDLVKEDDAWKIMSIQFAGDDITAPPMGGSQQ